MRNERFCIGIMSVGSGVGQSVISSCNQSLLPLYTIGFGNNPFAFGAYECDETDYLPTIYDDNYIEELINKCKIYAVDLIIPGSDDEAYILARNIIEIEQQGFKVLVCSIDLLQIVRDKELMYKELSTVADIFVKTYSYSEIESLINADNISFPLIAKPRVGCASRGVEILLKKSDFNRINSSHIIQELAIPNQYDPFYKTYIEQINKRINPQIAEISVQLVADLSGNIIGKMASYNKLNNGVPIEMIPYEDENLWSEIEKLVPSLQKLSLRGPLNIQGRWTDNGLKIYEMNARFTGITAWRALLGFNEVETCIKEWLDIDKTINSLKLNYDKFGIRQTTDKAISLSNNERIKQFSDKLNNKAIKTHKSVLVTGSGGYLGQALIPLLSAEDYEITAFDLSKENTIQMYKSYENVKCVDSFDFSNGRIQLGHADYLIHCGFARPYKTNEQIAQSLKFTEEFFTSALMNQVSAIVNISSQSVYGTKQKPKWTEDNLIIPETVYSTAKYSTELMLNNVCSVNKHVFGTSLRLSSLSGGQNGLVMVDILAKFVQKAINNENIEIIGGTQRLERLDVRDAAEAIISLLKTDYRVWQRVYNLGNEKDYSILEMAQEVKKVAKEKYNKNIEIDLKSEEILFSLGMDASAFRKLTNWEPQYSLTDTIVSLFEYIGGKK